jgi:hypothetical protein
MIECCRFSGDGQGGVLARSCVRKFAGLSVNWLASCHVGVFTRGRVNRLERGGFFAGGQKDELARSRLRKFAGLCVNRLGCLRDGEFLCLALVAPARLHADGLQAGEAQLGQVAQREFEGVMDAIWRAPRVEVVGDLVNVGADLAKFGEDARNVLPVDARMGQAHVEEAGADESGD